MAPQDQQAWLVGMVHEYAADGVALCATHADRITVPFGWHLADNRPVGKPRRSRKKKASATQAAPAQRATASPTRAKPKPEPKSGPTSEPEASPEPKPAATTDPEPPATPGTESDHAARAEATPGTEPEAAPGTEPEAPPEAPADLDSVIDLDEDPADAGAGQGGQSHDEPTVQLPVVTAGHPSSPAEVPLNADATAAAVDDESPRLSVVPGEDDPNKTFDFADDGQGALWAPDNDVTREPDETTPMLKRAFRVVRDD